MYSVYLGVDGKVRRLRNFFADWSGSERWAQLNGPRPVSNDEPENRKTGVLYNLERLKIYQTELTGAVSFYLSQGALEGEFAYLISPKIH
jgi:hypothetical protein